MRNCEQGTFNPLDESTSEELLGEQHQWCLLLKFATPWVLCFWPGLRTCQGRACSAFASHLLEALSKSGISGDRHHLLSDADVLRTRLLHPRASGGVLRTYGSSPCCYKDTFRSLTHDFQDVQFTD